MAQKREFHRLHREPSARGICKRVSPLGRGLGAAPSQAGRRPEGGRGRGRPGEGPRPLGGLTGTRGRTAVLEATPGAPTPRTTTDLTLSAAQSLEACSQPHMLGPQPSPAATAHWPPAPWRTRRPTARASAAGAPSGACAHRPAPSRSRCSHAHVLTWPLRPGHAGHAGRGPARTHVGSAAPEGGGASHLRVKAGSFLQASKTVK